jgi:N-formylglutamate amidohydrolase
MLHERHAILEELSPPFAILSPIEQVVPFIFCSPHSGAVYPSTFVAASRLDRHTLRKSEDVLVDRLFAGVAALGAPMIAARFPRAYLDVNREPYELDPELFDGPLPAFANSQSMRVAGGLGTIARVVADAEEIYAPHRRPTLADAMQRIELLYTPFHDALRDLIATTRAGFGTAILVDCHSMPSTSMARPSAGSRPDIVLGDRFGASCDARVTRTVRDALAGLGLQVQLNRPYAGGYITEHYGRPYEGVHAIQIEINRALYLDEVSLQPLPGFDPLRAGMMTAMSRVMRDLGRQFPHRIAAE